MDDTSTSAFNATPTTSENIHARIDAWHQGAGAGAELHRFLGWTWKQYAAWVKSGAFPQDAATAA